MKSLKMWIGAVAALTLLIFLALLQLLWSSRIETTQHGVHVRLLIPTGTKAVIGVPTYAGTGDAPVLPRFLDGPVVRREADKQWRASWFCEDRVYHRHGRTATLEIDCAGQRSSYPIQSQAPLAPAVFAQPARMLILSDIEGNARFLDAALRELGVMNQDGRWTYGAGHLVIAGDAVDRGREVFAVLWRLYALSIDAAQAGGAVHLVLGNHEQYLLQGNPSRAHREHLHALERLGGQMAAFAPDTILGHWLRQQPVLIQAGDILVTHGGISPEVAASGLGVAQLNDAMRRYWRGEKASTSELEAVIGLAGLSQYRGYFESKKDLYAKAGNDDLASILGRYDARAVVVGHTAVERIETLYEGRVHAVNVNSDTAASEALLFEHGNARTVSLASQRGLAKESRHSRPLHLTRGDDWHTLGRLLQSGYQLAQLPFPY